MKEKTKKPLTREDFERWGRKGGIIKAIKLKEKQLQEKEKLLAPSESESAPLTVV